MFFFALTIVCLSAVNLSSDDDDTTKLVIVHFFPGKLQYVDLDLILLQTSPISLVWITLLPDSADFGQNVHTGTLRPVILIKV